MKWILLVLSLAALASATPSTLFGRAGMPDPWELISIVLSGFLDADSVDTDHLVVNEDAAVTVATTAAGGVTGLYSYLEHATNALTGNLIGVRGSARVNAIDSPAGSVIGGYFQAGNMGVGTDLSVVRGVYTEIVNKIPSGATTWDYARGYEANMDLDQGTSGNANTITDAQIFYGVYNLPTVGTYATVTNGYGVFIRNEAVGGTGQMLDAGFYLDDLSHSGGIFGWDFGLDFSGIGANSGAFGTADIRGCNSETIDNITDGTWNLAATIVELEANRVDFGAGTVGDQDIAVYADSGGTPFMWFFWNEGANRTQFDDPVFVNDILRVSALLEFGQTASTIDFEDAGQGTGNIGLRGDKDFLLFNSNLFNFGDGTDGDFDIVCQADTGTALFTLWQYDEGDERLEFPTPVSIAELDVVEAGDAITVGTWTRHQTINAGSAALGPTAPSWLAAGETAGGLGFDADAEVVYLTFHIPGDWIGTSDLAVILHWANEPADALTNGQTVKWDGRYHSIECGTENINNGTPVAVTVTYTEAGDPGNDGDTHEQSLVIDYDHGDQPITSGDVLYMVFDRDKTGDTYDSQGVVTFWELGYDSSGLPDH